MRFAWLFCIACGGVQAPSNQTVAAAMTQVCEASTRGTVPQPDDGVEQEALRTPTDVQASVINHLPDGVTNSRVLAQLQIWRDTWTHPSPRRIEELDALVRDAGLQRCALRDFWTTE